VYLANLEIENFRCFGSGDSRFQLRLKPGLTALVGENEAGKSAVIDALRLVLGTTDQERFYIEDSDHHAEDTALEIKIFCEFAGLTAAEKSAFVEFLTYDPSGVAEHSLALTWTAKETGVMRRGRRQRRIESRTGRTASSPPLDQETREFFQATYLRPLRDAEGALSSGRGSRLAQVLQQVKAVADRGDPYNREGTGQDPRTLSVVGIGDLANHLLDQHDGIAAARTKVNDHMSALDLAGNSTRTTIEVGRTEAVEEIRLRRLLERLQLTMATVGNPGLGSNNLLFMACELLLIEEEDVGPKLLLIEEPESHLHAQRQLQVMQFLQEQARTKGIQIIVTTHSPSLASAIKLDNIVMIRDARAYSMASGETKLSVSDYRFLQRFLDATKANLFFARGVMIVEGDAESVLLPTIARLLGRDFTKHGVSIVNVGGVGLRRYARIFQREDVTNSSGLSVPVSCVTDMDVMPNCAPAITGRVTGNETWPETAKRRWRAKKDIADLAAHREGLEARASGQQVKTFVSDHWTLEYDLALGPKDNEGNFSGGLAEDVYIAACLAEEDNRINNGTTQRTEVEVDAKAAFQDIKDEVTAIEGDAIEEVVATHVYAKFANDGVSKPIAAQYLASRLESLEPPLDPQALRSMLPRYLVEAIDYVTAVISASDESGMTP
jgi:putative ATP-dependent endonuclease of the OLD family